LTESLVEPEVESRQGWGTHILYAVQDVLLIERLYNEIPSIYKKIKINIGAKVENSHLTRKIVTQASQNLQVISHNIVLITQIKVVLGPETVKYAVLLERSLTLV
jgi:hypothetical protein